MPTSSTPPRIVVRHAREDDADALAEILVDVVESGASVGFVAPLGVERAKAWWRAVLESMARGERVVLVALMTDTDRIVGTVQLVFATAENQPHRADVAKMQVHRTAQRQGIGAALLRAVEAEALSHGRTLLVLDTATGSAAERLYAHLGWQRCGEIPGYALWPDGRRHCSTTIFYRRLASNERELEALRVGAMLEP